MVMRNFGWNYIHMYFHTNTIENYAFSICIYMEIHMEYVFPTGNAYENMELHMIFAVV